MMVMLIRIRNILQSELSEESVGQLSEENKENIVKQVKSPSSSLSSSFITIIITIIVTYEQSLANIDYTHFNQ